MPELLDRQQVLRLRNICSTFPAAQPAVVPARAGGESAWSPPVIVVKRVADKDTEADPAAPVVPDAALADPCLVPDVALADIALADVAFPDIGHETRLDGVTPLPVE
jgi:hypothetical protein